MIEIGIKTKDISRLMFVIGSRMFRHQSNLKISSILNFQPLLPQVVFWLKFEKLVC
jgi:hypothetical protein